MRRGMVFMELVGIIVVLALGLVIALWIPQFKERGGAERDVQVCRFSIKLAAESKFATKTFTRINCPRQNYIFKDETSLEINSIIARNIANGVYITGEGYDDWTNSPWLVDDKNCIVLSTYTFGDDHYLKDYDSKSLYEFTKKNTAPGRTKTYHEYFKEVHNRDAGVQSRLLVYPSFGMNVRPTQSWVLFFVRVSKPSFLQVPVIDSLSDWAMETVQTNVAASALFFAPLETISFCDVVIN